jgi:tetratricopeptide (TPR) repeat protein
MPSSEWYRCISWTSTEQAEFEARLKRSRGAFYKAQYLRIQAVTLLATGSPALVPSALALVARLLREYPDEEQLLARTTRAECLARLGRWDEALDAYRVALDWERTHSGHHAEAYLDFVHLILYLERRDLYGEAEGVLDAFGGTELFPVSGFRFAAARALLAEYAGDRSRAIRWAQTALEAAARTESGLRYHPDLGLVGSQHTTTVARLRALCAT